MLHIYYTEYLILNQSTFASLAALTINNRLKFS